jgi:lipid A ethanolaminephosphotransferase
MFFLRKKVKFYYFILLTSLFITSAYNLKFLKILYSNIGFSDFASISFFFTIIFSIISVISILLLVFGQKYVLKPLVIFLIILSSILSFYNQQLGVTVDEQMIINTLHTDAKEAIDLMSITFFIHIFFLGIIPSIFISFIKLEFGNFGQELLIRISLILIALISISILISVNFKNLSLIVRNNNMLNQHITPLYTIMSSYKLAKLHLKEEKKFTTLGLDAKLSKKNFKTIGIMVVGETARSDRFFINGYNKETNPLLMNKEVISFKNTISCGTSTAYSVPCMFFLEGEKNYNIIKSRYQSNVLDVLELAGIKTIWINNNSSCKHVCDRIAILDLVDQKGTEDKNSNFDEILLDITNKIVSGSEGNILIVLHTIGSHGPSYYKRFPEKFAKFKPYCKNESPQNCSKEELSNAFDNTILYTDYILSSIINILEDKKEYDTFMFYASDHGESLGENGIYLHGLPKKFSIKQQTDFAMLLWLSDQLVKNRNINVNKIKNLINKELNHDYISHTLLNLFGVESLVNKKELSLIN